MEVTQLSRESESGEETNVSFLSLVRFKVHSHQKHAHATILDLLLNLCVSLSACLPLSVQAACVRLSVNLFPAQSVYQSVRVCSLHKETEGMCVFGQRVCANSENVFHIFHSACAAVCIQLKKSIMFPYKHSFSVLFEGHLSLYKSLQGDGISFYNVTTNWTYVRCKWMTFSSQLQTFFLVNSFIQIIMRTKKSLGVHV